MTDIHCHILPNIDDGAIDIEDSLEMAKMAFESGVSEIAATPHFNGEESSLDMIPIINERLSQLKAALAKAGIPVTVYGGAEILCGAETPYLADDKLLPTLGEGNYVLCEFYFDEDLVRMESVLGAVLRNGYIPVVAHPERYEDIQQNPAVIERWFNNGCIIQVNRGSVFGRFGSISERTADFILYHGFAHVIASDAHSSKIRTPHMADIKRWAVDNLGTEYARVLLAENPSRIIKGHPVVSPF